MKNESDSKENVQKSSSSTSEVVETMDLTLRPITSTEPNLASLKPSGINSAPNVMAAQHVVTAVFESVLDEAFQRPTTSENNGGIVNSTNVMHNEHLLQIARSKKSVARIPPSYSTVLKLGPPVTDFDSRTYPSIPFITRLPPPSYAEVHGGWDENPSILSADSFSLGPDPLYISCPRCRTIVISDIHTERSNLSYVVSLVLCVCLCWPCCLLPFCLKSCRNTYHFCPTCHFYLGVYRPC